MFTEVLEKLTIDILKTILPSYGIDSSLFKEFETKFEELKNSKISYMTIPHIIENVMPKEEKYKKMNIAEKVKKELITQADSVKGKQEVKLYRGDTRSLEEIQKSGGFFGREDAPITIEHARIHINEIANPDWVRRWKAQTKGSTDLVPYVATGQESQKAGTEYEINIPLIFEAGSYTIRPKIGTDSGDIKTAKIIALLMTGGEVVFLTGIPMKFISISRI